ncbi:SWIM zinc finger family protein [Spirosoma sp. BT702]|uniref:SWIM zinc finger family protein n=1 Tax=Spirosoma profusum TaxID=2771354 RepID=A0A926XWN2_9BACT|nr:DUF6880 family protein [Spirosoma profusum]MBD2701470.1 SWIM zinc finger family protein [Spirosoma profusum]
MKSSTYRFTTFVADHSLTNMLTLDNFDQQLPKDLLKKAQPYFQNKKVLYVEQDSNGIWQAEVEGSDTYSVEITLSGRTIADSFCDCPVESPTCKHVVAVLFALREAIRKQGTTSGKAAKKVGKKSGKLTIADLVQQVSADELRAFVVGHATSDKTFASKLQLHFADKDERIDVGKQYTDLVRKIIREHTDRRGFIDYRSTFKLAKEINTLQATGVKMIAQRNFKDALTLSMVLLREMMIVLGECDDSAGNIGSSVSGAIDLLQEIAIQEDAAPSLRRQLVDQLAKEVLDKRYFGYSDAGILLLDVVRQAVVKLHEPDLFLDLLDQLMPIHKSGSSTFYQDFLRTLRVKFLRDIGRDEEADRETEANMDIVAVRAQAVNQAIQARQYDRAKKLLHDGVRIAEGKKHPGTVQQWEQIFLTIAEAEGDTDEIRRWAKKFAFDRWFNVEYFRRWKATFSPEEWAIEYQRLVEKIRQDIADETKKRRSGWGINVADDLLNRLGPIFTEEKQWPDLLVLIQQAPRLDALKQALPHLASLYPSEMLALLIPAIRQLAEHANTRSDYKGIASWLKLVRKTIANSHLKTDALINELKATYLKRPAFQEELSAIK